MGPCRYEHMFAVWDCMTHQVVFDEILSECEGRRSQVLKVLQLGLKEIITDRLNVLFNNVFTFKI